MSGGLFVHALLRETGHQVTAEEAARLQRLYAVAYARQVAQVRVPWAIATSVEGWRVLVPRWIFSG